MKETGYYPNKNNLALFIDGDNFPWNPKKINIARLLQFLSPWGNIKEKKLFTRSISNRELTKELEEHQFSITKVMCCPKKKNAVDIRLTIDVIETILKVPDIKAVVLVTGDGDFMPLIERIKQYQKAVIGIGSKKNTAPQLIYLCNVFLFYEDILLMQRDAKQTFLGQIVTNIKTGVGAMETLLRKKSVFPPIPSMRHKILKTLVEVGAKISFPCKWKQLQEIWIDTCELWGVSRTIVRNTANALIRSNILFEETDIPFAERIIIKLPSPLEMEQAICQLQMAYILAEPDLIIDPLTIAKVVFADTTKVTEVEKWIQQRKVSHGISTPNSGKK